MKKLGYNLSEKKGEIGDEVFVIYGCVDDKGVPESRIVKGYIEEVREVKQTDEETGKRLSETIHSYVLEVPHDELKGTQDWNLYARRLEKREESDEQVFIIMDTVVFKTKKEAEAHLGKL